MSRNIMKFLENMNLDEIQALFKKVLKDILKNNSDEFVELMFAFVNTLDYLKPRTNYNKIPTPREEGNVITAFCFRNTLLEDIHSGSVQFGNITMKELMKESSWKVTEWLIMRDTLLKSYPKFYHSFVNGYEAIYTREWDK